MGTLWLGPGAENLLAEFFHKAGAKEGSTGSSPGLGTDRPSRLWRWHWVRTVHRGCRGR